MFIYETRSIFSEDGDGPFRGLVIKATPADFFPAMEGETVVFLEETEEGISLEESFSVGEEAEEGKKPQKADTPEELVEDIANAEDGAVIKLTSDMAMEESLSIPSGKSITVDLGGNEISGGNVFQVAGGELTLKNGTVKATAGDGAVVTAGGKLTIDGAEIISETNNGVSAKEAEVIMNSGSITSQEAGILGLKDSVITINGGEITGIDNGPVMGNGSKAGSKNDGTNMNVVMNGGKLIAHIQSAGYIACGVYVPNSGSFTMNGGEIISDGCGICQRGGTVNLNGGSIVANGTSGEKGKVGDSRIVVGPYAVVYDAQSKYPAVDSLELNIGANMQLESTDGADNEYKYVDVILGDGYEAHIHDDRA